MLRRFLCAALLAVGLSTPAVAADTWTLVISKNRGDEMAALAETLKRGLQRQTNVAEVLILLRTASVDPVADFIAHTNGRNRSLLVQTAADLIGSDTDAENARRRSMLVATMTSDTEALAIDSRSPVRSLDSVLQVFQAHPRMYAVIGGTPRGGIDHALVSWIERAGQLEPDSIRYLAADSTEDALARLNAGEAAAVIGSFGELRLAQQRGQVRILATTAAKSSPNGPPTFTDQGLDIIFHNWRGVLAPPSADAASIALMRDTLMAALSTDEWKAAVVEHGWQPYAKTGKELQDLVDAQERLIRSLQHTASP